MAGRSDGSACGNGPGNLPSLYEYVGTGHTGEGSDVPQLVGRDNTGAQITQCGTSLGGRNAHNAVSAAGSTVFFSASAGGCRSGATARPSSSSTPASALLGTQATVNAAAKSQSECASSTSCGVTSAVSYQGAAMNGSKVFFTRAQAGLVSGDADATNALYECELPGDAGATPAPCGKVNACPTLKAISVTGTSAGASVQSVVSVSEEGSRVYYIATGVVTSAPPNSQGQTAQAGKDNLYVYEPDPAHPGQYRTLSGFIATLPTSVSKERRSRRTANTLCSPLRPT